jgi:hypothetical protein
MADQHPQQLVPSSSVSSSSAPTAVVSMPPANNMLNVYASAYFGAFTQLFHITKNGTVSATRERLQSIEAWFNQTHVLISLITGIPLQPITFNYNFGPGQIATKNANSVTLTHVYAMCYSVMLRMANTLGKPVPEQYMPQLRAEEVEESLDVQAVA